MCGKSINIKITLNEYLSPSSSSSDCRRDLGKRMIADDFLFILMIDKWQMQCYGKDVVLFTDQEPASSSSHTRGMLVFSVNDSSHGAAALGNLSFGNMMSRVFGPLCLIPVWKPRVCFN